MAAPECIRLEGGNLLYWPNWLPQDQASALFDSLHGQVNWQQDRIVIFGKEHPIPRLQCWYGNPDAAYSYSGLKLSPNPWLPELESVKNALEPLAKSSFNSVLVNLYRNGQDCNGWHADNEPELGPSPVIASVSLGATRRFRLRQINNKTQTLSLDLLQGSLLIMEAGIQENWQHQLAKTAKPVGARVNLTYRCVAVK